MSGKSDQTGGTPAHSWVPAHAEKDQSETTGHSESGFKEWMTWAFLFAEAFERISFRSNSGLWDACTASVSGNLSGVCGIQRGSGP